MFPVFKWYKSHLQYPGLLSLTIFKQHQIVAERIVSLQLHESLDPTDCSHLWQLTCLTALTISICDSHFADGSHVAQGMSALVQLHTLHLAGYKPFDFQIRQLRPPGQLAAMQRDPKYLDLTGLSSLTSLRLHAMCGSLSVASTAPSLKELAIYNIDPDANPCLDQSVGDRMQQRAALHKVHYEGPSLLQVVHILQTLPGLRCLNLFGAEGPQQNIRDMEALSHAILALTGLTHLDVYQSRSPGEAKLLIVMAA